MVSTAKIRCTIKPEVIYVEASRFGGLGDSVFGGRRQCSQGKSCAERRPASSGGMHARDSVYEIESFCGGVDTLGRFHGAGCAKAFAADGKPTGNGSIPENSARSFPKKVKDLHAEIGGVA